ncbi:conserved hypothetical protein, DUF883 [Cupriavidus phytorum]|uniref:DUF883 domain-containing protein n=2 Tax=Cupriavidus TaxID=106589 RepID=A0A375B9T7_9BURK|nr:MULTISPECIES: DUF883 family protein [Cupriavidus]PZX25281.1 ElaB/YqjD/DUF883 family membrane-anchored ribosome-binding protein [Cupriavidus alkaliphilus]SOY40441.1 conserved hypothetical protein, DUF883 [Cupriavidus taiwanensis]SPA28179.1 conserved hypothetical protein, DUF883 [Cupriavidus taiwanensis]SPA47651.1 conserved hypothetical protein, DUF883 [Cupriavidus taiwanensis]
MLTQNPKVRKELNHLSDSADSAIRHIKHAARDTREAAAPVSSEVKSLISQLEHTIQVLAREGSAESLQAGHRLRERASDMAHRLRAQTADGMMRARERVDGAVVQAQHRVAESPLKAVAIAAAVGAVIGLLLANGRHHADEE